MKALSLREPWLHAVLHLGKTIENRRRNLGRPEGLFLLHAAVACSAREYADAVNWMLTRRLIARADVIPPRAELVQRAGGIVGVARIVDMIPPNGTVPANAEFGFNAHPHAKNPWWMAKQHGYVLEDVRAIPLIPCRGYLGFFKVPDDVEAKAREHV